MNSDLQDLKNGMFWKTISTGMNALTGFFMSIVFARFLGKHAYGELILVYTVVSFFIISSGFGLQKALQRFIPLYIKRKDEQKITTFILSTIVLGIFFTTLFSILMFLLADFIAVNMLHKPSMAIYMRCGVLYLFTFSLLPNIVFSIYYGFQKWKEECVLNGMYLFSSLVAVSVALALFDKGIVEILKINATVCLLGVMAGMIYIVRLIKFPNVTLKFEEFKSQIKETLYFSAPLFMSSLLFYFITQFDKFILGMHRTAEEVAQYYIAFALGTGFIMLVRVSETVLTPYLAKFTGENDAVLKTKFQILFRLFLHLPIVFSIFIYFLIEPFIKFVYGPNFGIAITASKIYLIINVLRLAMTPVGLFLLNVYAKTFEIAKLSTLSTFSHCIFYLFLIPRYGYKGALAAVIISYIIDWAYIILVIREIKRIIPYRSLLWAAVGIVIVASIDFIARSYHIYNKLFLSLILPSVYLLFILSKGELKLSQIKNAV